MSENPRKWLETTDPRNQILVILNYFRLHDQANRQTYNRGLSVDELRSRLIKIAYYSGPADVIKRDATFPRRQLKELKEKAIITYEGEALSGDTEIKLVMEVFQPSDTFEYYMKYQTEIEALLRRVMEEVPDGDLDS